MLIGPVTFTQFKHPGGCAGCDHCRHEPPRLKVAVVALLGHLWPSLRWGADRTTR